MRQWLLAGVVGAVLLLGAATFTGSAQGQCSTSKAVRVSANADCVLDTGVGVGLTRAEESRIIRAVNLFGSRFDGNNPAGVCLEGEGALYLSRAASEPRMAFFAWYYVTADGFTCTNVDAPATVILVEGESPLRPGQAPAMIPTAADDAAGEAAAATAATPTTPRPAVGQLALDNCRVVTRAILNLRDAPSLNSNVIDLIPYRTLLRAINRDGDWFNVIVGDKNGWVTAALVNTRGRCG